MHRMKILKNIYVDLLVLIMILIVLTPYLISSGFSIFREEVIEGFMITVLFVIGYIIYLFYQKEVEKTQDVMDAMEHDNQDLKTRIDETFRYIGTLNVQIEQINEVFSAIKKYPENKKDFKAILEFLSAKILGIVNTDWVLLRIVDLDDESTIREFCGVRGGAALLKHEIHNKELLQGKVPDDLIVHRSEQTNLTIRAFCVFPKQELTREQCIFLKAITNQLEMLFIVFTSPYTRNHHKRIAEKAKVQIPAELPRKDIFSFQRKTKDQKPPQDETTVNQ